MTLMRFDPFRELDRFTEQVLAGGRAPRTMPMEAFRRGDNFFVYIDLPGVDRKDADQNNNSSSLERDSSPQTATTS